MKYLYFSSNKPNFLSLYAKAGRLSPSNLAAAETLLLFLSIEERINVSSTSSILIPSLMICSTQLYSGNEVKVLIRAPSLLTMSSTELVV